MALDELVIHVMSCDETDDTTDGVIRFLTVDPKQSGPCLECIKAKEILVIRLSKLLIGITKLVDLRKIKPFQ
jgi:hypothetical protein